MEILSLTLFLSLLVLLHKKASFFGLRQSAEEELMLIPVADYRYSNLNNAAGRKKLMLDF